MSYERLPEALSKEEFNRCMKNYKDNGDIESRNKIIEHNMRMVQIIVNKYGNFKTEKADLMEIGLIVLIKAIDTYDSSKNCAFSTYAYKCINNALLMHFRTEKKECNNCSINQPIGTNKDGKNLFLEDTLIDDTKDIMLDYEKKVTYQAVREIVEQLPEFEKKVIMLSFGFIDDKIYTQRQIASMLNYSQAHISRVTKKALENISLKLQDVGIIDAPLKCKTNSSIGEEKKENLQIRKEIPKMDTKLQTIYEYLNDYSKNDINQVISNLSEKEKQLITLRYGENLEKPFKTRKMSKKELSKFYGCLIPKMRRLLSKEAVKDDNTDSKIIAQTDKENSNSNICDNQSECKEIMSNSNQQDAKKEIEKEDYIKMLEMLKTPNFSDMLKILTPKEAIIVGLRLGYVDNKYFTTASVAKFLGIDEEAVIETTKKALLVYKETFNNFIDEAINITTGKNVIQKKL